MIKINTKNLSADFITEGGEGSIYNFNGNILKIYKKHIDLASKQRRIQELMKLTLPPEIIGPIEEVYNTNGKFIGFIMKKIEGDDLQKLYSRKFAKSNNITTKDILEMLCKIKKTITYLHSKNIFIGDLNDQNIMFDHNHNVYFIDCDSWSIGQDKCEVAMDLFKDPLLVSNNFDAKTDTYSFCILAWKCLTRIHPFGGTTNPEMTIDNRMKKGISVIDNPDITIPRTIKSWRNLSPKLIASFKDVFEKGVRTIGDEIEDMYANLKFCNVDGEYYYGKFTTCPLCDANAKLHTNPTSQGTASGISLVKILNESEISLVINETTYIDNDGNIVDVRRRNKVKFISGIKYYFLQNGITVEDYRDKFVIKAFKDFTFEKKYKSRIVVMENKIYFLDKQSHLICATNLAIGNSIEKVASCANTAYFEITKDSTCIVNIYEGYILIMINGITKKIDYDKYIVNYGLHYDVISKSWLVVFETKSGKFDTFIIDKKMMIEYSTDLINYACSLNNLCLYNNTLFIPIDGKIRGFAFQKDQYKDFDCSVVSPDSKLIKRDTKFIIINDENIYNFG